jgi:PBP1b-binding outer membrane lipoprotein LpoB
MKKGIIVCMAIMFLAACSGNADRKNESSPAESEAVNEQLEQLESAAQEVNEAADELAAEVDSLLNNL